MAVVYNGNDKTGIVPDGVMPFYCESYFLGKHILDFINLPREKDAKSLCILTGNRSINRANLMRLALEFLPIVGI